MERAMTTALIKFDLPDALCAQARLRLAMATTCIVIGLTLLAVVDGTDRALYFLATAHLAYATLSYFLPRRVVAHSGLLLAYATAVLDSVFLTLWIISIGEPGFIIASLYLFTAIGFGMRTGNVSVMRVSQLTALIGFCAALYLAPYWRGHFMAWLSYATSIVILPSYVGVLMTRLHAAIEFATKESRAKSDLLARVSHELRTPLGGITNAAELIQSEARTDRHRHLATTILTLSDHLLGDINDLLDQSKLAADAIRLAREPIDLTAVAEIVLASVGIQAAKKEIGFTFSVDPRVTDRVIGDTHYLDRVLVNLAGNAVKFTSAGQVTVHAALLEDCAQDYLIRFTVQDTGIGIPEEAQKRIFEPFVQYENGPTRRFDGTGLGLAISRQIVALMGGILSVRSDPGRGSTFWFDLRMEREQTAPVAKVLPSAETLPQAAKTILIVDDNHTNLHLLREILLQDNHTVLSATSGQEALDILAGDDHIDAVLLDYNLGDMDGQKVLQTYRFGRIHCAPTYFLTADATLVTQQTLASTGALGVLTKPVRTQELRQALARAVSPAQADVSVKPATQSGPVPVSKPRPVPLVYLDPTAIESLREIGSRPGFVDEMLIRAAADISANCARLVGCLTTRDFASAREAAHALKGVCLEIGAVRLMNLSLAVMRTDDPMLLTSSRRLIAEIEDTGEKTRAALRHVATAEEATQSGRSVA
jgi:two-component system sensor histidine kinase RpfC